MATTALGGVVNIGHRNMHDSVKMLEEEVEYGRLEAHAETSMESGYGPQSNSPGVLMTAVGRSIKSEASPASPDSTMSSSSSSLGPSEDSHVSVLRRGPSAAPPPFVPFTAAPPRISTGSSGGLRIHHQHHQPASVARRNARERNRVKQVNNGFATLRQHIPPALIAAAAAERAASPHPEKPTASGRSGGSNSAASKKMSKVETLRCAVEYIRSLQEMLREADGGSPRECDEQELGAGEVCEGLGPELTCGPSPESSMVRCSPASSPVSSSADSSFLPASPPPPPPTAPGTTPLVEDGARHYLPLQPVQPFEYIDIDAYSRLQGYEGAVAASAGGVLQFYHHERIKREEEDMESAPMMLEPHPATGSPPPHGYSTSATAYLAMAPGPHALLQRQPGDEVDMVTEGDVTGMMTWWTEEPQC